MTNREKHSEEPTSVARIVQQPDHAPRVGASAPSPVMWQASSVRVQPVLGSPVGILMLHQLKGNRVASQMLAVQQSAEAQSLRELSSEEIHSAAAKGINTPATTLPYLDRIQTSFGRYSIGHVKAHFGSEATKASQAMKALAFASGDHVVFGGTPDLRTAAHEAAHVVQQQAGLHLAGGIGHKGDAYERHADAVADAVVTGRSSEELLEKHVVQQRTDMHSPNSIQRYIEDYGDWSRPAECIAVAYANRKAKEVEYIVDKDEKGNKIPGEYHGPHISAAVLEFWLNGDRVAEELRFTTTPVREKVCEREVRNR